jgi:hypothetical protein
MASFKDLGMRVANQNCMQEEMKEKIKLGGMPAAIQYRIFCFPLYCINI